MELSVRQQQCLKLMGVMLYEKKIDNGPVYWICIDELLTDPKQELLFRMLAALRWPLEKSVIFQKKEVPKHQDTIPPIAGIILTDKLDPIFNALLSRYEKIIQIPSLESLLTDLNAKKRAWQRMQTLL